MKRKILLLFLIISAFSCNKDVIYTKISPVVIYPNPFVDQFTISFLKNKNVNEFLIRVYDGNETIVKIDNPNHPINITIDMSEKPEGIYHLETILNGESFIEPIIKIDTK